MSAYITWFVLFYFHFTCFEKLSSLLASICTDDIMSCCIGLQNTLIVPTETSNIWLVGINTILTPILGKQVNIHPLGECIHPLGNRMQDISLAYSLRSLNGSGNILHSISRGMNTPSRGMNIHLHFPVSELILCSYQAITFDIMQLKIIYNVDISKSLF